MRSKRHQFHVWRLSAAIAVVALALSMGRFHLLRLGAMFGYGTVYASGYTEEGFRSVTTGMSSEEVLATIGTPLRKVPWTGYTWPVPGSDENWWYSEQPPQDGNYYRRWLLFKNGRVLANLSYFYVD
jgi:hypothetical protein